MRWYKRTIVFLLPGRDRSARLVPTTRQLAPVVSLALAAIVLSACSTGNPSGASTEGTADPGAKVQLTVLAAASLTEAFDSILPGFESPGLSFSTSYGASSTLALQVQSRAPADLIATADQASMTTALEGRDDAGAPEVFAYNDLVIAVQDGNPRGITSLQDLTNENIIVSICAPAVPCGKLAETALDAASVELPQASRAPDVKATLAPLIAGEVDAALVYRTDVMAGSLGLVELPEGQKQTTEYVIAALDGPHLSRAQELVDYLLTPPAQVELKKFGFTVP